MVHFIEIMYCIYTRLGAQLEASHLQISELCKQLQGAETTPHTILLGASSGWATNAQMPLPNIRLFRMMTPLHTYPSPE
eukprot:1156108-Pelagomonas_calceolata.AAC.12